MFTGGSMRPAPADEAQRKELQDSQYSHQHQQSLAQYHQTTQNSKYSRPEQQQHQHFQHPQHHHQQQQHHQYYMNRQVPPAQQPPSQFNDSTTLWNTSLPDIGLHHVSFERSSPPSQYDYQYQDCQAPTPSQVPPAMVRTNTVSTCGTSYCAQVDCDDDCADNCGDNCDDDGCEDACNEPDCEVDECAVLCTGGCGAPPEIDCEDCQKCRATVCKDKSCIQTDCSGCEPCPSAVCSTTVPAATAPVKLMAPPPCEHLSHGTEFEQPTPIMHYHQPPSLNTLTASYETGNRHVPQSRYNNGMGNLVSSQNGFGQPHPSYGSLYSYPSGPSLDAVITHAEFRPSKRRRSDTYTMQSLMPPSPVATHADSSSSCSPSTVAQHRGSFSSQSLMQAPCSDMSTTASTPTLYNSAIDSRAMSMHSISDENLSYFCHWGNSCEKSFTDYPALDDHVLNAHVRPLQAPQHTDYVCHWESCSNEEKDLGQLLHHVKSLHATCPVEAAPHEHALHNHICLWQGCNASFPTPEDLSTHLATEHIAAPLCMWDECGQLVDGFDTLATHLHTTHVVPHDKHLNLPHVPMAAPGLQINSPSPPAPPSFPVRMHSVDTESAQSAVATSTATTTPTTVPSPCTTDVGLSQSSPSTQQEHDCKWWDKDAGPMCGEQFASADALQAHVRDIHIAALKKKTGYFCFWADCCRRDKQFSQKGKVERHMQTHTGFKSCRCPHCDKEFSAPQALQQHIRTHTGEKPYKCDICGKEFAQGSAMTMHKRVHTGERPLMCDYPGCGKRFSESSNLSKHRKTHNAIGQHICGVDGCGRSFHRLDQMKRHQRTHNKNTPGKSVVLTDAFLTAFRGGKRPLVVNEAGESQGMGEEYDEEGYANSYMQMNETGM